MLALPQSDEQWEIKDIKIMNKLKPEFIQNAINNHY